MTVFSQACTTNGVGQTALLVHTPNKLATKGIGQTMLLSGTSSTISSVAGGDLGQLTSLLRVIGILTDVTKGYRTSQIVTVSPRIARLLSTANGMATVLGRSILHYALLSGGQVVSAVKAAPAQLFNIASPESVSVARQKPKAIASTSAERISGTTGASTTIDGGNIGSAVVLSKLKYSLSQAINIVLGLATTIIAQYQTQLVQYGYTITLVLGQQITFTFGKIARAVSLAMASLVDSVTSATGMRITTVPGGDLGEIVSALQARQVKQILMALGQAAALAVRKPITIIINGLFNNIPALALRRRIVSAVTTMTSASRILVSTLKTHLILTIPTAVSITSANVLRLLRSTTNLALLATPSQTTLASTMRGKMSALLASGEAVSISRYVSRAIRLLSQQIVSAAKIKPKLVSVTLRITAAVTRTLNAQQHTQLLDMVLAQATNVKEALTKAAYMVQDEVVSMGRDIARTIASAHGQAVALLKAATATTIGIVLAERLTLAKRSLLALATTVGQAASVIPGFAYPFAIRSTHGFDVLVSQALGHIARALMRTASAVTALTKFIARFEKEWIPSASINFVAMAPMWSRPLLLSMLRNYVMPQAQNTLTPIDSTVEERIITFDFGVNLASGVTLLTVAELSCVVISGVDPDAQGRVLAAPAIVDAVAMPYGSGVAKGAVSALIGNMIAGVTYRLQCVVTTSDGQELSLWQHLDCIAPQ